MPANQLSSADRERVYQWILELASPDTREHALLELRYTVDNDDLWENLLLFFNFLSIYLSIYFFLFLILVIPYALWSAIITWFIIVTLVKNVRLLLIWHQCYGIPLVCSFLSLLLFCVKIMVPTCSYFCIHNYKKGSSKYITF